MPNKCCVKDCNHPSGHRFPSDPHLRKDWVIAVRRGGRGDIKPTDNTIVCHKHFRPEDFLAGPTSNGSLHRKKRHLKPDAVPSLFFWRKHQSKKDTQREERRKLREEKKKLLEERTRNNPVGSETNIHASSRTNEEDLDEVEQGSTAASSVDKEWRQAPRSCRSRADGQDRNWILIPSSLVKTSVTDNQSPPILPKLFFVMMEEDIKPTLVKPVLDVNLDSIPNIDLSRVKTEKLSEEQVNPMYVVKKERNTEHPSGLVWWGDNGTSMESLEHVSADKYPKHMLTFIKPEGNTDDHNSPVRVEETERTVHSEPFPVSLIKCERLQDGDLTSYRCIPLVKGEHSMTTHVPGQHGERVVHPPAFESCGATPVVTLEEGCGGRSGGGKCEVLLSGSGGESLQQSPLPEEDFKVVLNPDYVEEEGMDCQEEREEQEAEVPLYFQVKVEPGISSPATSSVHEKQGPPSPPVHLPSSSSTEVPDTSQSLASQERAQSSHLDRACARVPESKKGLKSRQRNPEKHSCPDCEYKSVRKDNLNEHIDAVHRGIKKYSCSDCEYKGARKAHLCAHIEAVHKGLKKYSCPDCEYKSARKDNLNIHIDAVHRGIKKFSCPDCEYRCSQKVSMTVHIEAVHKGVRKYSCSDCEYRSAQRSNLNNHIKIVHRGMRIHSCPDCEYKSLEVDSLNRHIDTVHRSGKQHRHLSCDQTWTFKAI